MIRILLMLKKSLLIVFCAAIAASFCGCMPAEKPSGLPEIPARLRKNNDGVPMIDVYDKDRQKTESTDVETYVMGVVAGEMRSDWPIEALKAQAILARTFTMKFLSDKTSRYPNADISTDIEEAQAYNAQDVNERVREAVNETRGTVMTYDGEFVNAWFHAYDGGKTELPSLALEYSEDPAYLRVADSPESEDIPEDIRRWTAEFSADEVRRACAEAGTEVGSVQSVRIGRTGESGRAATLRINGREISAPSFRLRIGADRLKSTLIEQIEVDGDRIHFTGRGFGHGVGMSQWGAYAMAKEGKSAEAIVNHYFRGVELNRLW